MWGILGPPCTPRLEALEMAVAGHMEPSPLQVLSCPPICTNWAWGRRTGSLLRCLLHPSSLASTLSGVHCPSNSASPALSSFSRPLQASLCSQEQSYFLGKVKHTKKNSPLYQPSGPGQSCCGWCSQGWSSGGQGRSRSLPAPQGSLRALSLTRGLPVPGLFGPILLA